MDNLSFKGNPVSHGHKVAIGSLACLAFIEILFADPDGPPSPPADFCHPTAEERVAEIRSAFAGNAALESTLKTGLEKLPDEQILKKTCEGFRDTWKTLRENVMEQVIPYGEFKEMLAKAQCPVKPEEVNLKRHELIACARRAQMIRMRYTALDLAWELGCFETVLAKMEASDKYF
jgi:glycerol-1-phosphate dehydrogenase [NAD(P)+]